MASRTYYVDARSTSGGTGLSSSLTGTDRAFILPSAAISAASSVAPTGTTSGAGHTVNIANGTYTESGTSMTLNSTNLGGITINGESRDGVIINPPHSGSSRAVLTGVNTSNITANRLTLTNGQYEALRAQAGSTGNVWNDIRFYHNYTNSLVSVGGENTFNRCIFESDYSLSLYAFTMADASATATLNNCLVIPKDSNGRNGKVFLNSAGGVVTINNMFLFLSSTSGVTVQNGTLNIKNSFICGIEYALVKSGGVVNAVNNYFSPGLTSTSTYNYISVSGTLDTDTNNVKNHPHPLFAQQWRNGCIIVAVDDAQNFDYACSIADLFKPHGYQLSWYADTYMLDSLITATPSLVDSIKARIAEGVVEVSSHSYTHMAMSYLYALRISQIGGTTPTVTLDPISSNPRYLTLACVEPQYTQQVDVRGLTMAQVITATHGVKGWSVAKSTTASQVADRVKGESKSSSWAACSAVAAPCDILFDRSGVSQGVFKDEFVDPKNTLNALFSSTIDGQTGLPYSCATHAHNYDVSDSYSIQATADAGYISGRPGTNAQTPAAMHSVKLYELKDYESWQITDENETNLRIIARRLAYEAMYLGHVINFLTHTTLNFTLAQWGYFIDEWSRVPGLRVISHGTFARGVRATHTTSDNLTYTLPLPIGAKHLQPTSPCIGAGTAITGLTTDIEGNQLYPPYNIGPYGAAAGALTRTKPTTVSNDAKIKKALKVPA